MAVNMVRLSKKVEYGLIAIRHIAARSSGEVVTAKEIAVEYKIPYELLAKVLQRLTKAGLIMSHQGVRGGYSLSRRPDEIPVSEIIHAIEGTAPVIAQCLADGPESCGVYSTCTIKSPLAKVQENIERAFSSMTLSEIV
jgi:Rrf2 family protein